MIYQYDINVIMYSYKNKDAIQTLKSMLKNKSEGLSVYIHWHDQNGLDRSKLLIDLIKENKNCDGAYIYHNWDYFDGVIEYKNFRSRSKINAKYFMSIYPGITFNKDWDKKLIDFVSDKMLFLDKLT